MREKREKILIMLRQESLTQTWLIKRLESIDVNINKSELCSVLSGARKGKKAEMIIEQSNVILEDYYNRMGITISA